MSASELASVDAIARLVRTAAARIEAGYLNEASVDDLADELGVPLATCGEPWRRGSG